MSPRARLCPLAAALLLSGCGYVGDPLPPSLNIPSKVTELAVVEHGDKLVVDCTLPGLTTDGVPLRVVEVDLRLGPDTNWPEQAKRVQVTASEPGPLHLELPVNDWVGREIAVGVRAGSRRGRFSEWSDLVRLRVVPPLPAPSELKVEPDPKGVRLTWRPAAEGATYRVYRKAPAEKELAPLSESQSTAWVDETAQYGKTYEYAVQAVVSTAESPVSAAVSIAPKDIFPPAVPAGLTAVAAAGSIELTWTPNAEPDLKGYVVYRAGLQELVTTPSYSDRKIESGKRYSYQVSAVDQAGNESPRSAPVEATAQ